MLERLSLETKIIFRVNLKGSKTMKYAISALSFFLFLTACNSTKPAVKSEVKVAPKISAVEEVMATTEVVKTPTQIMLDQATLDEANMLHDQCVGGQPEACNILGIFYENGTPHSVAPNIEASFVYYAHACSLGHKFGCANANLVFLKLDSDVANRWFDRNIQIAFTGCVSNDSFISCDTIFVIYLATAMAAEDNEDYEACYEMKRGMKVVLSLYCSDDRELTPQQKKECVGRKARFHGLQCYNPS